MTTSIAFREKSSQILTIRDFQRRKRGGGVIVIYDRIRPEPVAHKPNCFHVTAERFAEKVLEKGGKNGRYWWFDRFEEAEEKLGARRCLHCGKRRRFES